MNGSQIPGRLFRRAASVRMTGLALLAAAVALPSGCSSSRRSEREAEEPRLRITTRAEAPAPVVAEPAEAPTETEAGGASPAMGIPTRPATVIGAPTRPAREEEGPGAPDEHGFDGDDYLTLMTPDEIDVLRLRARSDTASHLSRFLSEKEKGNLRRRAAELTEIGAEPLSVGE